MILVIAGCYEVRAQALVTRWASHPTLTLNVFMYPQEDPANMCTPSREQVCFGASENPIYHQRITSGQITVTMP